MLRNEILRSRSNLLEGPLTVEEIIMREEVDPPESVNLNLKIFSNSLCCTILSSRKERLVTVTSADVVYASSGGKHLPGKQIS